MKAWEVDWNDNEYMPKIVWAETIGKAKSMCVYDEELGEPEYVELTARRVPWADNLQGLGRSEFDIEWLKHGLNYYLDAGECALVDYNALPLIKKCGGLFNFENKYFDSEIVWNEEKGFVEVQNDTGI